MTETAPATSKWRGPLDLALGQDARREERGGEADRHVDEQHPLPAGVLGQEAAEQHAGGAAGAGDRAPDAQRAVALGALGEGRGDDRQRGRGEDRGAEALDGAGGDQPARALGETTGQRGGGEEDQAGDEDAAAAEQVGHAPAEQQEAAEDERVRVDDPGQVLLGEVEVAAHRGQRDVDDRGVEDDDELRRGEQRQREALAGDGSRFGHGGRLLQRADVEAEFRLRFGTIRN